MVIFFPTLLVATDQHNQKLTENQKAELLMRFCMMSALVQPEANVEEGEAETISLVDTDEKSRKKKQRYLPPRVDYQNPKNTKQSKSVKKFQKNRR